MKKNARRFVHIATLMCLLLTSELPDGCNNRCKAKSDGNSNGKIPVATALNKHTTK